jgi:hypothetical protein
MKAIHEKVSPCHAADATQQGAASTTDNNLPSQVTQDERCNLAANLSSQTLHYIDYLQPRCQGNLRIHASAS